MIFQTLNKKLKEAPAQQHETRKKIEIQNFDNELNKNAYIFNQKGQVIIVRGISE